MQNRSRVITGSTPRLRAVFNPPLVFVGGSSCNYEMDLIKLETYYSFPNIKAPNNRMKLSIDKYQLVFIKAINKLLQRLIVESAVGTADKIIISSNNNTLKCILDIKYVNYQVDFAVENSLRTRTTRK